MPAQSSILRITLVGLVSLALAMGIGRFAFTPLLPMMLEDGLVSIIDGGFLASVHFFGYWLGAVLAAKIPYAPKTTLRVSLVAVGVATLGMGVTDNLTVWLFLRWLSGVCSALTLVLVSNYYVRYLDKNCRADYQGWVFSGVGAGIFIAGLACLVFMANQIGSSVRSRQKPESLSRLRLTLREYYRQKQHRYAGDLPTLYDRQLSRVFPTENRYAYRETAGSFLRRSRQELRGRVAATTGHYRYVVEQALNMMISRCRELNLLVTRPERETRLETTILLTMITMGFVHGGNHEYRR